jgi:hypothetical protein
LSKVIGGFAALIALGGGILARVDPLTSLWRAGLVFLLGWLLASVWYVFFTVRIEPRERKEPAPAAKPKKPEKPKEPEPPAEAEPQEEAA